MKVSSSWLVNGNNQSCDPEKATVVLNRYNYIFQCR